MQKNHAMKHTGLFLKPFILLVLTFFLVISSCNDKKSPAKKTAVEAGGFKMNCVVLTKAQIQTWVDSGWTRPAYPGKIKSLLFQFYSADGANAASNMQLLVYPGQSVSDVRVTGRVNLAIDTTCVALKLSGPTIISNNAVNIRDFNIINADGSLKDFDFIRLRPVRTEGEFLSFNGEVVKIAQEKETILMTTTTHPCPPYCPKPPPTEG